MSESGNWQASLLEQRMAWGIAAGCLILVLLASSRPGWFDFSAPRPTASVSKQLTKQAVAQPLVTPTTHAARHTQPAVHPEPPATAAKTAPATHAKRNIKPSRRPVKAHVTIADGFYIQLGAFHERPRARGLADQLKRKGFPAVIISKSDGLHAVWVGPKHSRGGAEKLLQAIHRKLKHKGFIIHQKAA